VVFVLAVMALALFVLSHAAAAVLFAAVCCAFGAHATRRVAFDSALERASFSTALGLGIVSHAALFVGLAGRLTLPVVAVALALGLAVTFETWSGWLRAARGTLARGRAGVAAAVAGLLPFFALALYPPTTWDATMYHLAYGKIYLENHAVVFTPYLRFPVFPQTNDMLFALAMLVGDDVLAQCVELLMMATLAAALVAFGARFLTRRAGWWAAAVFLGSPLVVRLGTVAYVDMGLALFAALASYATLVWLRERDDRWLAIAAVSCGFAVGTKYTALFTLLVLAAVVAAASAARREFLRPVLFVAAAVAVCSPWLLRNAYYMRNPLFPFFFGTFGRLFGYGAWGPEEFAGLYDDYSRYGVGTGVGALLLLPWNLVVHWRAFGGWMASPLALVVPHAAFVAGVARRAIAAPLAIGTAHVLFWFYTSQESHYLLPALPMLSAAAGGALDGLAARFGRLDAEPWRRAVTAVGVAALVAPGWVWTARRLEENGAVPATAAERGAYLARWLPTYPAYERLNATAGRDYAVYAFNDENMAYFADGRFMGDHFGLARYSRVEGRLADGEALAAELERLGATHFHVRSDALGPAALASEAFRSRFRVVYDEAGVTVFELR
jgi:4-amino-4-deoxy-L-arabinose transferase-like glycosyltransferase